DGEEQEWEGTRPRHVVSSGLHEQATLNAPLFAPTTTANQSFSTTILYESFKSDFSHCQPTLKQPGSGQSTPTVQNGLPRIFCRFTSHNHCGVDSYSYSVSIHSIL